MLFNIFIFILIEISQQHIWCLLSEMLQLYLLTNKWINRCRCSESNVSLAFSEWRNVFAMQSNKTFKCGNQINVITWFDTVAIIKSIQSTDTTQLILFISSIQYPPLELTEIKFHFICATNEHTLCELLFMLQTLNADCQTQFVRILSAKCTFKCLMLFSINHKHNVAHG